MKYEWLINVQKYLASLETEAYIWTKIKLCFSPTKLIFPHQKDDYSRHGGWEEKQALVRGAVFSYVDKFSFVEGGGVNMPNISLLLKKKVSSRVFMSVLFKRTKLGRI